MMWQLLVAGSVFGLALTGARALRAELLARRTRRAMEWLGEPAPASRWEAGSVVTIEGTLDLGAGGAIATFFPFGVALLEETSAHAVTLTGAHDAAIVVGSARVAFDPRGGQIVRGARETGRRERWESADERLRAGAKPPRVARGMFRWARTGDRVRARGRLRKVPAAPAEGYRGEAAAFELVPDGDDCAVPIVATKAPRPSVASLALHVPLAAALAVAVFFALVSLYWSVPRSADGIVHGRPACGIDIDAAIAHGKPWEAASIAGSCPDHASAAWAAVATGDVRTASERFALADDAESLAPTVTEVETYVLGKDPTRARLAFGRLVAQHFAEGAKQAEPGVACLDEALGRRAGALDAELGLRRALDTASRTDACELMRDDFGLYPWRPSSSAGNLFLVERMPSAANEMSDRDAWLPGVASVVVFDPASRLRLEPMGLMKSALDAATKEDRSATGQARWIWDDDARVRTRLARYAADVALLYAIMGEMDGARDALAPVDALAAQASLRLSGDADEEEMRRYVFGYAAAVAFVARDDDRVAKYLDHSRGDEHAAGVIAQVRAQASGDALDPSGEDVWNEALLRSAVKGDGAEMASALRAAHSTGRGVLARMVPHLKTHREALVQWLHESFPSPCLSCGVVSISENVADRRYAARLLGDGELESRLAPIAKAMLSLRLERDGDVQLTALRRLAQP